MERNMDRCGHWMYEYGLTGIGSYDASRIFGAKFEVKEIENPSAMTLYLGVDEGGVWSTNGSDGSQMAISNAAEAIIGVAISAIGGHIDSAWTAVTTIIDLMKSGASHTEAQYSDLLSWNWLVGVEETGQYSSFVVQVDADNTASISTEYSIYYGSTEADIKWLSTGVFEFQMPATGNPNTMTEEERIENNIITVPRDQIAYKAAELDISPSQVKSLIESDQDEFYFIGTSPICLSHDVQEMQSVPVSNESYMTSQVPETTELVVLSDSDATISSIEMPCNVSIQTTFDSIGRDDIVLIDGDWATTVERHQLNSKVRDLVDSGNAVLLMSESSELISSENTGYSTAFATDADVYGIRHDPLSGATYCYSYVGMDAEDSMLTAYEWAESYKTANITRNATTDPPILYAFTKVNQGGLGEMVIETKYTKSSTDDWEVNLILTEYSLTGTPYPDSSLFENNKAIADMTISCEHVNSELLDYGPSFSSSTLENHTVDLEALQSTVHVEKNWDYTILECETTVNVQGDSFEIHYDTDEYGSHKTESKTARPGTICLATNEGPYCYQETEYYSVNYLLDKAWSLEDTYTLDECSMVVSIFRW